MRIGNREFRPRIWPTIATLILLPVLLRLGFWQLERAEEKQAIEDRYTQQQARAPVALAQLDPKDTLEYRRVTLSGRFDDEHQIYLDNQVHQKKAGYHVLTPLQIGNSGEYILVNRGWVDGRLRRDQLPKVATPEQGIKIAGRLKSPSGIGLKLAEKSYTHDGWPLVVQWVDIAGIEEQTGYEIYPYILQLGEDQPYGFVRDWRIISSSPEQSESYAAQWFTLAAALILIFIFVNSRKIDHAKHERE